MATLTDNTVFTSIVTTATDITDIAAGALNVSEVLNLGTHVATFNITDDFDLSGIISGEGTIVKNNTNTMTLSGDNTYEGGTTISAGFLSIDSDVRLGLADSSITLSGGTLQFTGTGIDLSSRATLVSAESTIMNLVDNGNRGGTVSFPGVISGTANLNVTGGDNVSYLPTLALDGINTNTGVLDIATGNNVELSTDAVWAGTVTLSGDLKGDGTVTGLVTSTGGRVSPGAVVGTTMHLNGGLTLDNASTVYIGLDDESTFDNIDLGTAGVLTVDAPNFVFVPYVGTLPVGTHNFDVITSDVAVVETNASTVEVFPGYADGNDDETDGTFTFEDDAAIAIDATNNYRASLSVA